MAKRVHWYLEGWVRQKERMPSGKKKTVWHYTGDYYRFSLDERGLRRLKASYGGCIGLESVLWFVLAMIPSVGKDEIFYVGGPWYVSMIPLMFLIIGGAYFMRVRPRMTYRDMRGSYQVIVYSNVFLLVLHGLSVVGMIVFLFAGQRPYSLSQELLWLAGALVCTGLDGAVMALHRRYPPLTTAAASVKQP